MINKKISKILGTIIGIMGFMLTISVLEVPVLAVATAQSNLIYTDSKDSASSAEHKDYSLNINKSAEENGLKITLCKAIATKHKLKVTVKIENKQSFDQSKYDDRIVEVTYGQNRNHSGGESSYYLDDKTLLITIDKDLDKENFPEKGDLRLDVVFPIYKVNVGIDADVDFSEAFKNTTETDVSAKISELNFTLNKIESNILGTEINYSAPYKDYSNHDHAHDLVNPSMILKVGNVMYTATPSGSSSSSNDGKNDEITIGTYDSRSATYDRVKDKGNMSIIPVISDMSYDDLDKLYEEDVKNSNTKEKNDDKQTINNVTYSKSFKFSDGTTGEIYNVERNDNNLKVYYKGSSEKESLLMASNMSLYYKTEDENSKYFDMNTNNSYMSFYKNSNDSLGYVVEFDNVDKNKAIELSFSYQIKQIDKYKLGTEVQLSNN